MSSILVVIRLIWSDGVSISMIPIYVCCGVKKLDEKHSLKFDLMALSALFAPKTDDPMDTTQMPQTKTASKRLILHKLFIAQSSNRHLLTKEIN